MTKFIGLEFDFEARIGQQVIYLVAIGCAGIVLGYLQVAFCSIAAERQTIQMRKMLFQSILLKEIAYFDVHKTGELNTKLTNDIKKIHDGIGDKLGSLSQFVTTFVAAIIIDRFKLYLNFKN